MIATPVELLSQLIASPSLSRNESATAAILAQWLGDAGIKVQSLYNNVWALQPHFDPNRPTLMLNSHHDTVRPASSYTRDPYLPKIIGDKLYGLGANDAGASIVTLAEIFRQFYSVKLPFNLLLALTAEEEVMGEHGMRAMLPYLAENGVNIDMALVGEPTAMQPAIGERGLVVIDCVSNGITGHAARSEGDNALYHAIDDIIRLREFKFPRQSEVLGPIGINITQIEAGRQHNVIPETCSWVVDVRTTDVYTNEETVEILKKVVKDSQLTPRSTRVRASLIPLTHPMVKAAMECGGHPFVSLTTSDMALMHNFPSLKMGPGQSSRSHSADEFVLLSEIDNAINIYTQFINHLQHNI